MLGKLSLLLSANASSHNLQVGQDHPTISATVAARKYFLKFGNTSVQPVILPVPLEVRIVSDIFYKNKPVPFATLAFQYTLPAGVFVCSINIFSAAVPHFRTRAPKFQAPKFWQFWFSLNHLHKGISMFYNCLHDKISFSKYKPLLKWFKDLKQLISVQQWLKAITANLTISKYSTNWEMAQSLNFRWYYTPYIWLRVISMTLTYAGEDVDK